MTRTDLEVRRPLWGRAVAAPAMDRARRGPAAVADCPSDGARLRACVGGLARTLGAGSGDAVSEPSDTRRVLLAALVEVSDRRRSPVANGPL